ncbi:MAG: Spore coat protein CotH [Bacteroidetes bacterium]|nr:MAG: Spore coat protein CotH [Bacteroidota bacterium]
MNRLIFGLILSLLTSTLNAQTWYGLGGVIPDDGTPALFEINVTGLNPATIDTLHGIAGTGINLTHPYDADLLIALVAPDGTSLILSSGNGGDGDNYLNTHFTDTAALAVAQGSPPFSGYYRPQEMLGNFNNGREGNGSWYLYILDTYPYADQGLLLNWSITFGDDPTGPFFFDASNLPIVLIDTYGQEILDDPKILAGMKIIDNAPGQRNHITDPPAYDGYAGIEIRGSSSQMFPKKSYGFETWNALGEEFETSLLGMPEETDWILNANYTDKTLVRNTLAYQTFRNMGHYSTRYEHVEVVINGVYKGVYIFSEKIKRDGDRVDIAKLKPDDNSGDPLTGGYIFKIDKPTGSGGGEGWASNFPPPGNPNATILFQYEYPKADEITDAQKEYIAEYVNTFESTLNGPNFDDPENGFRKYADEGTFLDFFIVNEISKNVDGYRLSTFVHKERDSLGGKLRMGPVWDYDIAWRNANYYGGEDYTGWMYQFSNPDDTWQIPFWWGRLLQDTLYADNLKCRWTFLRNDLLSDNAFDHYIDSLALVLDESKERNFTVWPILGVYVWPNPWPYPQTYAEEIETLKGWIHNRLAWLDENIPGTCYSVGTEHPEVRPAQLSVFPNPAKDNLWVNINTGSESRLSLTVTDPFGRIALQETVATGSDGSAVWHPDISGLKPGVWFLRAGEGSTPKTIKFVKL